MLPATGALAGCRTMDRSARQGAQRREPPPAAGAKLLGRVPAARSRRRTAKPDQRLSRSAGRVFLSGAGVFGAGAGGPGATGAYRAAPPAAGIFAPPSASSDTYLPSTQ